MSLMELSGEMSLRVSVLFRGQTLCLWFMLCLADFYISLGVFVHHKAICTCSPTIWWGHSLCPNIGYNVLCFIVINDGTMKRRKLVVMMTLEIRELPKKNWLPGDNIGIRKAQPVPVYSQDTCTTGNLFNLLIFVSSGRSTRWPQCFWPPGIQAFI